MRAISRLLVVVVVVCFGVVGSSIGGTYGGGLGTAAEPYEIGDANDMNEIGLHEEDWGSHFLLIADIDMSDYTGTQYNIIELFTGVFDGNEHVIRNFTYVSDVEEWAGLFGETGEDWPNESRGEIKDLTLENVHIDVENGYGVGGVAADNLGTITNCHVTGYVSGNMGVGGLAGGNTFIINDSSANVEVSGISFVGGLVGGTDEDSRHIDGCWSAGSVTGQSYVGGLAGNNSESSIANSYSNANVSGTDYVGGVVGRNESVHSAVINCYATGDVTGDIYVGGVAGWNDGDEEESSGVISRCFATGDVVANDSFGGGLVGYNVGLVFMSYATGNVSGGDYLGGIAGKNIVDFGDKPTGEIWQCYSVGSIEGTGTNLGGIVGIRTSGTIEASYWNVETSGLANMCGPGSPAAGCDDSKGKTTEQMKQQSTFTDWDFINIWAIEEHQTYPYIRTGGTYGGGLGTAAEPYEIRTADHMQAIGADPNDWGSHFVLMADIDMGRYQGQEYNIIGRGECWSSRCYGFTGIPFTGVFDGNGHVIRNLTYSSTDTMGVGLFGYFKGAVRDLGLVDVNISVTQGQVIGGLVGYIDDRADYIENCYVTGSISGEKKVGGLIGGTDRETDANTDNCYSRAVVHGREDVGGLIGYSDGRPRQCYSFSIVEGETAVGGLVGRNGVDARLVDCYAGGIVIGDTEVGGLVGKATCDDDDCDGGEIVRCYSVTRVEATGINIGGLVGYNRGTVTNSYWDIETSGIEEPGAGIGLPTSQLHHQSTFTDWDFINVWDIGEKQTYPYIRTYSAADINKDRITNFGDLCIVAGEWMREE